MALISRIRKAGGWGDSQGLPALLALHQLHGQPLTQSYMAPRPPSWRVLGAFLTYTLCLEDPGKAWTGVPLHHWGWEPGQALRLRPRQELWKSG